MRWWRAWRERQQMSQRALRAAERALFGDPAEQIPALIELGHRLYVLDHRAGARRCFREVLTRDTHAVDALYGLAIVEARAGRREDAALFALQALRVVLEDGGTHEDACRVCELADTLADPIRVEALVADTPPGVPDAARRAWLSAARATHPAPTRTPRM